MASFLFWNLNRQPLGDRIARAAAHYSADFVLLAECLMPPAQVLAELNARSDPPNFVYPFSQGSRIQIYTRRPAKSVIDEFNSPRMTIRQVDLGPPPGILLAVVHFQSKGPWDRDDQTLESTALAADIARAEDQAGHQRTILVGDFNMNPFDPGVIGAQALHATMTRGLAGRGEREIGGKTYRFFYNPMWGHFGDRTPGPPGTYYLRSSKPGHYFWNMYDQLLLRPALTGLLDDLQILDTDGHTSLLTKNGLPKESDGSDHLPILFRLRL
jgi:hypothetical protein